MTNQNNRPAPTWTSREAYLLALVCLAAGLFVGSLFRGSSPSFAGPASGNGAVSLPAIPAMPDPNAITTAASLRPLAEPLLAALKVGPKNVETLVQLGNLYYDHHIYPEAIEYYTRALELRPRDVNVRTDLGTAFWYAGFPEKAVAEYQKSLAIDPAHANTLFNLGVVRSEGLKDYPGAIAAWEKLLAANPQHPEKQRVLDLIAQAKSRAK